MLLQSKKRHTDCVTVKIVTAKLIMCDNVYTMFGNMFACIRLHEPQLDIKAPKRSVILDEMECTGRNS